MGFKFRKSKKIAPGVRVNFNKKSSSVTFGSKGLHHTISSTGKKTTSAGIPGSGLYYTSSSGGGGGSKNTDNTSTNFTPMIEIIILQIRIGIMVIKILSNIYFIAQLLLQSF